MAAWTTFDSECDVRVADPSCSLANTARLQPDAACPQPDAARPQPDAARPQSSTAPRAQPGAQGASVTPCGVSASLPIDCSAGACALFDPLRSLGATAEDACCYSLPAKAAGSRVWPALAASTKCSSSCENLDTKQLAWSAGEEALPHTKLCKASSDDPLYGGAPPVPPRDYAPRAGALVQRAMTPRRAEIHPVVQHGQQLSRTHYWLLPDKQRGGLAPAGPELYMNVPRAPLTATRSAPASSGGEAAPPARAQPCRGAHEVVWTDDTLLLANEAAMDTASIDLPYIDVPPCDPAPSGPRPAPGGSRPMPGVLLCAPADPEGSVSMSAMKDMLGAVQARVDGVTTDESLAALSISGWRVEAAVRYLKVEHLFRLGMATRARCQGLLEAHQWDVERAASAMVDQPTSGEAVPRGVQPDVEAMPRSTQPCSEATTRNAQLSGETTQHGSQPSGEATPHGSQPGGEAAPRCLQSNDEAAPRGKQPSDEAAPRSAQPTAAKHASTNKENCKLGSAQQRLSDGIQAPLPDLPQHKDQSPLPNPSRNKDRAPLPNPSRHKDQTPLLDPPRHKDQASRPL